MVIGKLESSSIVLVVVVSLSIYYKVLSAKLRFFGRNAMSWGVIFEGTLGSPGCLPAH